jgi:hypothetical protein
MTCMGHCVNPMDQYCASPLWSLSFMYAAPSDLAIDQANA